MIDTAPEISQTEATDKNETLASVVYRKLRNDIIKGSLEPNNKLRLQILKETYNVGNSPLREALNRLSAEGLVVREENRGFKVAPADLDELWELVRTRCWLEEVAIRESIANGDADWEEQIVLTYHWLSRTPRYDDSDSYISEAWEKHHRNFHLALLSACNSNILIGYCAQMHQQTVRYHNLAAVVEYRKRHELDEHKAILDAALERNADEVVRLLHAHYKVTADIIVDSGHLNIM